MRISQYLTESRFERGMGSREGRAKGMLGPQPGGIDLNEPSVTDPSNVKPRSLEAEKSKFPEFDSVKHALQQLSFGAIFTVEKGHNLYVVTKAGWGKKSSGKVIKSFKLGDVKNAEKFSKSTRQKHGGQTGGELKPVEEGISTGGSSRATGKRVGKFFSSKAHKYKDLTTPGGGRLKDIDKAHRIAKKLRKRKSKSSTAKFSKEAGIDPEFESQDK